MSVMEIMGYKMQSILILFLVFFPIYSFPALRVDLTQLQRVDPHGDKEMDLKNVELKKHTACQSCHYLIDHTAHLKPEIHQRCVSCHGESPHSGVLEHIGKDLSRLSVGLKGKVVCHSCHRPHRAGLTLDENKLDKIIGASSFLKVKKDPLTLKKGLIEQQNTGTFLRRTCTECHRW